MNETVSPTQCSPWVHPKAQAWFEMVIDQSEFIRAAVTAVESPEPLPLNHQRLLTSLLLMLGRHGIWPSNQRHTFHRIAKKLSEDGRHGLSQRPARPLSIEETRERSAMIECYQQELEALRRRIGQSKRVQKLETPAAWMPFWY